MSYFSVMVIGNVVSEIHKDSTFYLIEFSNIKEQGKTLSFDIHFCNNKH